MTDDKDKRGRAGDGRRTPFDPSKRPRPKPKGRDSAGDRPPRFASARPDRSDRPARSPQPDAEKDRGKPTKPRTNGERPARFAGKRPEFKPKRRPAPQTPRTHDRAEGEERIAKVIARAGVCSRRDAEQMIADGRVEVDGRRLDSPAFNVGANSRILIDGQPMARRERTRLWLFHKPRGYVTTDSDPEGRPTIRDVLPAELPRTVTIGRLDINTEGLLLVTNDGGLARVLELPATGWLRRYRVRVHGDTDQAQLDALRGGVTIDGIDYAGIEASYDRAQGANAWLTLGLREGKNREVKTVLEHIGLIVNRLIRVSFGPFQLGDLPEGAVEEVRTRVLKEQLGETLAAEAGVDFEAPARERDAEPEALHIDRVPRRPRGTEGGRYARSEEPAAMEQAPRPQRPPPRTRKHVSTLRLEKNQRPDRVRIERANTEDRRGRSVAVERVVPTGDRKAAAPTRNARRFRDEAKAVDASPRHHRDEPRGERPSAGERTHRAAKTAYGEGGRKPFRKDAPRRDRPQTGERGKSDDRPRSFGDKGRERAAGGSKPYRTDRAAAGERGPKQFSDAPRAESGTRWNKPAAKDPSRFGDRRDRGGDERPKSAGGKRPHGDRPSFGAGKRPVGKGAPRSRSGGSRGAPGASRGGAKEGARPPRRRD